MKSEQIENLPIEWKRGNGLRKSDLDESGKNKCILYGELYTKHKNVLIDSQSLSKTNKQGKVYSKKGDVLVPGTSTAAKKDMLLAREVNEDGILLGGDINIIRPNQGLFAKKYLSYYFMTHMAYQQLDRYITGATGIIHISNKGLKNLKVPLPPISEQQGIVSVLDKAFSAIGIARANAEQNLINAKELFESYLQNVFENKGDKWEELTLQSVSLEFSRGKSKHRPRGDKSILGGKYPLIQTGDISNSDHWLKTYSNTYNEKGLAQSKLWKKGTICIAIVGANVAETSILTFDSCFPDSVIGITVNPKKANNEYVEFLLQSFKSFLKEKGKGTARDNINLGTFKNQKFPFPSVKEQEQIVEKLNSVSTETKKLEAIYTQKIADLEEMKKSVLQKAFSGQLNTIN